MITKAGLVWTDPDPKKNPEKVATLIGILSWLGACGYAKYPDVFGRVTHVLDWIESKTGEYRKFCTQPKLEKKYLEILKVFSEKAN